MSTPPFITRAPTTEEIALWLGESRVEHLAAIRTWHGEAAVCDALEQVEDAPEGDRARQFFAHVDAAKSARRSEGFWPRGNYRDWYLPSGNQRPIDRVAAASAPAPAEGGLPSETERLEIAETILGHTFRDQPLVRRALTHSSAGSDNNEAMACLGDRIYNAWAARRVFAGAPGAAKGRLTDAIIHLCRGETQAEVFFGLELHALLEVGGSVTWSGTITAPMASTALEALVAALELDAPPACAEAFLDRVCPGPLRTALAAITA